MGDSIPSAHMAIREEKHVMLSYQRSSKEIVEKVYDMLSEEGIKPWMDIRDDIGDKLNDGYVS